MEAYKKMIWGSSITVVFLIILLIVYFFFIKSVPSPRSPESGSKSGTSESKPAAEFPGGAAAEKALPPLPSPLDPDMPLSESDNPVRELLEDCSSHPLFSTWLESRDILRQCAAMVDNIAEGNSPAAHLRFLESSLLKQGFAVLRQEDEIMIDPESYRRYDAFARAAASIQSEALVTRYRQLQPFLEEAYRELGKPGNTFHGALEQALEVLLKTPIPKGEVLLEEKVTTYTFADPRLEALNAAQKHLLRMGPKNIRIIQAKLREIKKELERQKRI
jgi:hypothetical protein